MTFAVASPLYHFSDSRFYYFKQIIDFSPPPVTFAFTFELFFVLYTPPTVELTITFEFTAVLRVGFVLDSKGIREAVEQEAPFKALNSFALKDTFDGVDEAMITLTASVTISVDVSAVIVKVGVSGKITFLVTVDLYDPYPEKSGGLVRPFELLTSGSNPLKWFEFGIQIFITISLYIKVGLFILGSVKGMCFSRVEPIPLISQFSHFCFSTVSRSLYTSTKSASNST